MNYFLKDILPLYPLAENVEFPELSDYLTTGFIEQLTTGGLYSETKILNRIERKYKYSEIGTSDISQFYDYLNQLIEENFSEYLMNLVAISETYSVQNIDTRDVELSREQFTPDETLTVDNDTPSNKLNIDNIKAGTSASNVNYETYTAGKFTETTHQESTSALNTTQFNVKSQVELNEQVQKALNKFVDTLGLAFSIVESEYYE